MKYILSTCLLLFISLASKAQDIVTLHLNDKGKDRYFETSKLISPVFKLEGDSIESYQGFGINNGKPLRRYKVKLPELYQSIDTGYTFLYSKVTSNSIEGYTAVLVANYSRRIQPAIIYVDQNNNLDFTDDGEPDTFYLSLHFIDIDLINPEKPEQKVTFRLSRFPFTKDLSFKRMADELFQDATGTKNYVGTSLSFREQRFNIHQSNVVIGADSFQVALQDVNYNGLYNDVGIDRILINSYDSETVGTDHGFLIGQEHGKSYFERNFKSYRVLKIDDFGRSIQFQPDPTKVAKRQLMEGKKVPKIRFTDSEGKIQKLRWYRRKPVYIYFWNREQEGFDEDTAALRMIQEKFCPMIKIITLNYGDNPKRIPSYVEVNRIRYLSGIATKAIIQLYQIEEVPYGFLLKRKLKLDQKGLGPVEVLRMLENGEIQSWH